MKNFSIVLYPSPGIGHLVSMVELGKLILSQTPSPSSFNIIILITSPPPFNTGSTSPYITHISQTNPSIHFHHLPKITLSQDFTNSPNHETLIFEFLRRNNPLVHQALESISKSSIIKSFIIDFFCTCVLDISQNLLNIPTYYFFTSGAACLAIMLYYPEIDKSTTQSLKDMNSTHFLHFPGFPPISPRDLVTPMLDRTDKAYEGFINFFISAPKSRGIIVNSFESLEPRAIKAISDGLCVPNGKTPPVHYIGPLIADGYRTAGGGGGGNDDDVPEWKIWLDSQPCRSVVFLCFGSLGLFNATQLKEIGVGLEKSGQRFLWVVRSPPTDDQIKRFLATPEPDLDVLLPEGFLNRTKERGLVVKSWVPQVAILSHESVGGFVTHCGWNSVLESLCAGVPMVAWPLYAEQRLNRVLLVEEIKLALPMEESEDGFVSSDEVEKRVNELMESEVGRALRKRVEMVSCEAKAAMSEGGSSHKALVELIESWSDGLKNEGIRYSPTFM